MLSEWERTCSLPQSEEVGSVSVWYSCSLVCLTLSILQEMNGKPNVCYCSRSHYMYISIIYCSRNCYLFIIGIGDAHVMCERVFYIEPTLILTKYDNLILILIYQLDSVVIAILVLLILTS